EQTLSRQSRIERQVVGRADLNPCRRPLDPTDAEALASGERPLCAADAAEHVRECPACSEAVSRAAAFDRVLDELGGASVPASREPPALAGGFVRLRSFSGRERRDFALWRGPVLFAFALFASGFLLLALPGLSAREQVGLSAAAFAPVFALLRAVLRSLSETAGAATSVLEPLCVALRSLLATGV